MDIFLTEIQIFELTGFTKTQLDEMIKVGDFPKPVKTERNNIIAGKKINNLKLPTHETTIKIIDIKIK